MKMTQWQQEIEDSKNKKLLTSNVKTRSNG